VIDAQPTGPPRRDREAGARDDGRNILREHRVTTE
jgi:hypothetical protein